MTCCQSQVTCPWHPRAPGRCHASQARTISFATRSDKSPARHSMADWASDACADRATVRAHRPVEHRQHATASARRICSPCARVRSSRAISCAMATPSSTAASGSASARRMRSSSGFGHADVRHLVGEVLGVQQAVERPHRRDDRHRHVRRAPPERVERLEVEHRRRHGELGARLDLVLEAPDLLVEVRRGRVRDDPDVERRRRADRLAADVASAIEARHGVGQADRVDVEHERRVGVVARLARIAGEDQEVAQADRVRAEQVRLHARAGTGRDTRTAAPARCRPAAATSTASDSALMRAPPRGPSLMVTTSTPRILSRCAQAIADAAS